MLPLSEDEEEGEADEAQHGAVVMMEATCRRSQWMSGWMDGGRESERAQRAVEEEDEMKVELSVEGLIEEEQGRTSKNII